MNENKIMESESKNDSPNLNDILSQYNTNTTVNNTQLNELIKWQLNYYFNINKSKSNASKVDVVECRNLCSEDFIDFFHSYNQIHGFISFVICCLGTLANILNIIVLTRKEMHKNAINSILLAISIADFFVILEYMPFTYNMYLYPTTKRSYYFAVYLLFHMHFSLILHTISILLTVTLAVVRFLVIKHPNIKVTAIIAQGRHQSAIIFSVLISPLLCCSNYFVFHIASDSNNRTTNGQSNFNESALNYLVKPNESSVLYRVNFWIHSVIIKLFPCFILSIITFFLIGVLCQANKRKIKLKGYNRTNNNNRLSKIDRNADRTTALLIAVLTLFLITEFPQGILALLIGVLPKCFLKECYNTMGNITDLLALINASVVFILYGLMSKQFRSTFMSIFFKRKVRNEYYNTKLTALNTTSCV